MRQSLCWAMARIIYMRRSASWAAWSTSRKAGL